MRDAHHSSSCALGVTFTALAVLALAACTTDGLERLGAGRSSIRLADAGPDRDLGEPLRPDSTEPPDHSLQPTTPPDHTVEPSLPVVIVPEDAGPPPVGADAGAY